MQWRQDRDLWQKSGRWQRKINCVSANHVSVLRSCTLTLHYPQWMYPSHSKKCHVTLMIPPHTHFPVSCSQELTLSSIQCVCFQTFFYTHKKLHADIRRVIFKFSPTHFLTQYHRHLYMLEIQTYFLLNSCHIVFCGLNFPGSFNHQLQHILKNHISMR